MPWCLSVEQVTWEVFWEAFPAKLAEELEADPEGPLGLGGLMGEADIAAAMRDAVQAYVGEGRGVGISVCDINALFPVGCRIGERMAEVAAAAKQKYGAMRLAGLQRLAGMPGDVDGLFVGRDKARTDLRHLLAAEHRHGSVRAIFLTGPSGVGKSALARTLAKDCLAEKAWATAYYVDLGGCHTMAEAAHRMCAAFQVSSRNSSVDRVTRFFRIKFWVCFYYFHTVAVTTISPTCPCASDALSATSPLPARCRGPRCSLPPAQSCTRRASMAGC